MQQSCYFSPAVAIQFRRDCASSDWRYSCWVFLGTQIFIWILEHRYCGAVSFEKNPICHYWWGRDCSFGRLTAIECSWTTSCTKIISRWHPWLDYFQRIWLHIATKFLDVLGSPSHGGDCHPNFARYVHFVRSSLRQIHFPKRKKKEWVVILDKLNYYVWLQSSQVSHDCCWMGLSQRIWLYTHCNVISWTFSDHPAGGGECCPICMRRFRADSFLEWRRSRYHSLRTFTTTYDCNQISSAMRSIVEWGHPRKSDWYTQQWILLKKNRSSSKGHYWNPVDLVSNAVVDFVMLLCSISWH